ncbi:choice-of-anchor tandem repeat GloVer-containing protein [Stenotrophobium rhamnosiphilum]|uniref:Uncharacterized protein n=1 Tax=Stenotrophobium rhamnosiphilum TaxID=2029166 RepID=A0A2T5MFM2_9GAMM|nr:choice-of-anchor tandem repeat GloVer-containing protein [Stenotrophobium rhamnosiphilum]PTU31349.1 hypothetical protein CJD38_08375 [Stenotrophobium rhamnosiphilum]
MITQNHNGRAAFPYSRLLLGAAVVALTSNFAACSRSSSPDGAATQYTLNPANSDGSFPYAGLVQGKDGNLYGTTFSGGANNAGTVYKVAPGGKPTTLYSFGSKETDGGAPYASLVQARDGNFYGTNSENGANGKGTVFQITPAGVLTTIHAFGAGTDGAEPSANLVEGKDGSLYGTTQSGGANGGGTIYKITTSGIVTTLYSFGVNETDAAGPYAGLTQANDDNFYGTTPLGGANGKGTVFKITPAGAFSVIYSFTELAADKNVDGALPYAGLVQGGDGNLYGATSHGGAKNFGTLFKITPAGNFTTLYSFTGAADGSNPRASLVKVGDGFYGTTSGGGANNLGTAFKVSPSGSLSTVHTFGANPTDSATPYGALVKASNGALYGTSLGSGQGSIYRLN